MSTQRLRYLMIIFCSISTVRSQEPCSSTVYRTIGGEDRRSVDYQFDINMDLAYSDDRLPDPAEWFRIVNIAGEDMPTSSPGTFRCGTWYPIWLNGQLPEAGVTTTQPVCLQTFKNECEHTWNIEVRNCSGLYYVYKLKQSPIIDSAYCFGRSTICPAGTSSDTGYTPDCRSYNTNITISAMIVPDLVKGSVYIPVFHDYNLEPVFKCHFDNPGTIYYYDIEWYINEISIKGDTNTLYGSNDTILRPRHWEASYDMNMLVKCAVRVRAGNGTLPSPRMYSPNYVAGIVIERYSYVVDEGQSVAISFTVTVPIGCNAPQLLNSCKETIKVSYPKVDSCQSSSHSGNPIVEETCGADINAAGWSVDRVHTLKVYGNIDNRYNSESVRYATLSLSKVQSGKDPSKAWDNVIIPDISISIRDGDTQLSGMECISQTDPSYRTFDWNWYSAQISGEHVLYKHKREPYRVHTLTSGCYWGSCNVGIAIRSHDSLFVVRTVDEVYNPIRLDNTDSDFRATFTSRTYPLIDRRDCDDRNLRISRSGKEFTVALPSGTEIFFRIKFDQSSFHDLLVVNNINIKPSVLDIDQTEGLCGFLNFDSTDDFTDANGTVVDRNQFVNSWSIPSNSVDSLFSTSPQFTNDQFYKKPFCVCGEEASGNVPIGDDFNTVHCNLTQPMEQCYNSQAVSGGSLYTTCSKIHKRNTDQSDEVVDIVPLKYAENFEERYIPPEIQWRSGWTEQLAREECLNAFTNFTALDVCKEFANLKTDEFVEPCITDIKATGGTTLLEGTITTMISSCITEVSRNETLMTSSSTNPSNETSITDSPVTGVTTLLDEIKSQLCINNCSNNGICDIAGICKCYPGFIGEQCSIAETLPPQKISVPGDGLCGTRSRSCTRTFINGVYESDNVWCKLTFFTLINNEKQISSPSIVVKGSYHGFTSISCPLTPSSRRRKRSVTLLPVEGYQISLSYDGTNFGDEVSIIIYDESCYSCNGTAGICVVLDSCPLFATTTATEYIRENDKSSQVNKFSSTTENWHRIPTSIHLTTQENIETSQTTKESMSTENVDIQTTQHSTTIKDVDTSKTKYLMTTGNADVVPTTPHSFANVETIFTSMDSISKQKETEVQITKQTKADPNVETVQTTEHLLTDEITYTQIDITTKIFPVKGIPFHDFF